MITKNAVLEISRNGKSICETARELEVAAPFLSPVEIKERAELIIYFCENIEESVDSEQEVIAEWELRRTY